MRQVQHAKVFGASITQKINSGSAAEFVIIVLGIVCIFMGSLL